jgi:hypothetical protein
MVDAFAEHTCLAPGANVLSRRVALLGVGGSLALGVTGRLTSKHVAAAPRSPLPAAVLSKEFLMAQTGSDAFVGSWTYRSFVNNPTPGVQFNDLFFAEAELVIEAFDPGNFTGRLVLQPGAEMALTGASSFGNPFTIRFQGRGVTEGIKDFVYDYIGYLVPVWPNGVNQVPAIVGSLVRTEPHSGGAQPGQVASWIAVKRP